MGNKMEATVASRKNITFKRELWVKLSYLFTLFLPDSLLKCFGLNGKEEIQHWREKVTWFMLTVLLSTLFLFISEGLPNILCKKNYYDLNNVKQQGLNIVHGKVVDINTQDDTMNSFLKDKKGLDISSSFPKFNLFARLPGKDKSQFQVINECVNDFEQNDNFLREYFEDTKNGFKLEQYKLINCPIRIDGKIQQGPCFDQPQHFSSYLDNIKGDLYYKREEITYNYILLNNKIYDIHFLLNKTNNEFLTKGFIKFVNDRKNKDVTYDFQRQFSNHKALEICMDHLLYKGKVLPNMASGIDPNCYLWLLPILIIMIPLGLLIFKLIFNLISLIINSKDSILDINIDSKCILFMNCFNETKSELISSINSLINTNYDDQNKLLMIICDGTLCSDILLDILNFNAAEPQAKTYQSIGINKKSINFAKVYSGYYYNESHGVPYILIIKTGNQYESELTGNRGKRDSLMILLNFLDGLTCNNNLLNPLEEEILNQLDQLEIDLLSFDYLLNVDGDIILDNNALIYMISYLQRNSSYMAVSGQILLNDIANHKILYPLQLFNNLINRNLNNLFDFKFNLITQLRSGLILYRLKQATGDLCIMDYNFISKMINKRINTTHTKHMILLGEEQFIHTSLLKHWNSMKLGYIKDAIGYTLSYQSFYQLIIREKNLFNTKLHNTIELIMSQCIVSSQVITFIVMCFKFIKLILSPIFLLYFYSMLIRSFIQLNLPIMIIPFTTLLIIVLLFLTGLFSKNQSIILGFIYYITFGIPFYYLFLPIYSILNMDDFNWYDIGGDQIRSRQHGALDNTYGNGNGNNTDNHVSRYTYTPYEKSINMKSISKTPSIPQQLPAASLYKEINSTGVPINLPSDTSTIKSITINTAMQPRTSMPVSPTKSNYNSAVQQEMNNLEKTKSMSWQNNNVNINSNNMPLGGIAKNFPLPPSTTDSKTNIDQQPIISTVDRSSIGSIISSRQASNNNSPNTNTPLNNNTPPNRLSNISLQGSLNRNSVPNRLPPFAPRDPKMMSVVGSDYSSEYSLSVNNYRTNVDSDQYTLSNHTNNRPVNQSINSNTNSEQYEAIIQSQKMISEEIYYFLQDANLHSITRREVKNHLQTVFGDNVEFYKDFIEQCIEEITLERLAALEELNLSQLSNPRDSQAL